MGQDSYAIGSALGRNWKLAAFVAAIIVGGALFKLPNQPGDEAAPHTASVAPSPARLAAVAAERQAAQKLAEDERMAKCNAGAKDLKQTSDALVKQGDPVRAMALLSDCSTVTVDPPNRALLNAALKTAKLQDEANIRRGIAAEKARKKREGVSISMSQEDVIASSWGKPRKINRTTRANSVREQWVYDGGYLYFVDGILTTIQN